MVEAVRQAEVPLGLAPRAAARALDAGQSCSLFFDGAGGFHDAWSVSPLVALDPRVEFELDTNQSSAADLQAAIDRLDRLVAARRRAGGTAETGVAALLGYDAFAPPPAAAGDPTPGLAVLAVDCSLKFRDAGSALLTERSGETDGGAIGPWSDRLGALGGSAGPLAAARASGVARTSLPRESYLRAVRSVLRHIARGDVYQANLSQRFAVPYRGSPFDLYGELAARSPAPRSAFVRTSRVALASLSPEAFLRVAPDGAIATWPIKGTRPRGATEDLDRAAAQLLLASAKDRAELLMIVDLERNDLSRVCLPGSVRVRELATLRSFAAVHHLVACVEGQLRDTVGVGDLIRATFPGGSISGAPKLRAMQILGRLEPVPRGLFTGSLLWFGDDGHTDSSILIRGWTFDGSQALLGAGGGIVADSDPESEWEESNHKAAALTAGLGFAPEEAR